MTHENMIDNERLALMEDNDDDDDLSGDTLKRSW